MRRRRSLESMVNLWSWDARDFFAEVLGMPGLRIVEELKLTSRRLVIEYSDV